MLNLNCKDVQHVKIYLHCNFEVNLITHFGVISLFHQIFQILVLFCSSYISKTIEIHIDVKFKPQRCSAYQDLPTLQF